MQNDPAFDFTNPDQRNCFDAITSADLLNLITQVRDGYEEKKIKDLGRIIALVGQLHRVKIAAFQNPFRTQEYLEYFNQMWDLEGENRHEIEDCYRTSTGLFLIVISGHRRTLAILSDVVPYSRNQVKVTAYPRIVPRQAALIQLSENNYRQPPAHRRADAIYRLHKLMQQEEGKEISKARLARQLGVNADTVRSALRFSSLPDQFQDEVRDGTIEFGHAVLLERLAEALRENMRDKGKKSESEIENAVNKRLRRRVDEIVWYNQSVSEFKRSIRGELDEEEQGQQQMFSQQEASHQTSLRPVAREIAQALSSNRVRVKEILQYLRRWKSRLGLEPISLGSAVRQSQATIEFVEDLFSNLQLALTILEELEKDGVESIPRNRLLNEISNLKHQLKNGEPQG